MLKKQQFINLIVFCPCSLGLKSALQFLLYRLYWIITGYFYKPRALNVKIMPGGFNECSSFGGHHDSMAYHRL